MQIVSGPMHEPQVHFEAPPSSKVRREMTRFIKWFNQTAPGSQSPLPALERAGLAHWHFVTIHPFEDGNGRIARALAEKALSQSLARPTLAALSLVINQRRTAYYEALARANQSNEITAWMEYFGGVILAGQKYAQSGVEFLIVKSTFFNQFREHLNARQEKALVRTFREGPQGFKGGLSAEKYLRITGTSRATATRDLQDLVERGALIRTGELKGTRYFLNFKQVREPMFHSPQEGQDP